MIKTNINIGKFIEGIFSLNTRRFGRLAEIMIKKKYAFIDSGNLAYDLNDTQTNEKIEVKFSRVLESCDEAITEENAIAQILESNLENRTIKFDEIGEKLFDCNIQQVKMNEFDILYYGCFFADKIMICKIASTEIPDCDNYSPGQHRGNNGEGQFHINSDNIKNHIENNLIEYISYGQLLDLL